MRNGMTKNGATTEARSTEERKARREAALRFIESLPEAEAEEVDD